MPDNFKRNITGVEAHDSYTVADLQESFTITDLQRSLTTAHLKSIVPATGSPPENPSSEAQNRENSAGKKEE